MTYFTWRESGLTAECSSLEAMESRFDEAASLRRRMANEGGQVDRHGKQQRMTDTDPAGDGAWGVVRAE